MTTRQAKWVEALTLIVGFILFLGACYAAASTTVYRYAHPEMTETQLILHLRDALSWK